MRSAPALRVTAAGIFFAAALGCASHSSPGRLPGRSVASGPQSLRIATDAEPNSLDPHAFFFDPNLNVAFQIYDALLAYDASKNLRPGLAERCEQQADPTVWICRLRSGVRFHGVKEGAAFDKEDVLATLERVFNYAKPGDRQSQLMQNLASVDLAETIKRTRGSADAYELVIKTKTPFRFLPHSLAVLTILQRAKAAQAQAVGQEQGAAAASALFADPNWVEGTGPYRLVGWLASKDAKPGEQARVELARATPEAAWDNVQYLPIPVEAARIQALREKRVDVAVNAVAPSDLKAIRVPGLRVIHLQLFQGGDDRETRKTADGATLHVPVRDGDQNVYPNPFALPEFRKALATATDRARLVSVVGGLGEPTVQYMRPGKKGHVANYVDRGPSLGRARRLLLRAAQKPGFAYLVEKPVTIPLHGPSGRYRNDELVLKELAKAWTEAFTFQLDGKKVALQFEARPEKFADYMGAPDHVKWYLTALLGGGVDNGHGEGALRLYFRKNSALNHVRYSSKEVDSLYERAGAEPNAYRSDGLYARALQRALMVEQAMIPLYNVVEAWAVRDGICFAPREDGLTTAREIVESSDCPAAKATRESARD